MLAPETAISAPTALTFRESDGHMVLEVAGIEIHFPKNGHTAVKPATPKTRPKVVRPQTPCARSSRTGYVKHGCRCPGCTAANSAYIKARRQHLKAEALAA